MNNLETIEVLSTPIVLTNLLTAGHTDYFNLNNMKLNKIRISLSQLH
jgi:hypothetical protein